jgi:Ulp1 family protease
MAEKRIQYYDSMAGSGAQYVKILSRYIQDEAMDKKGAANYDMSAWTLQHCDRQCTPQQQNGSDCGVFTILFADFVAANLPLSFQQSNVSECRMKICASILAGKVWYSE